MNLAVAETTISLHRSAADVDLDNLRAELAVLYGVPLGSIRLRLTAAPPRSTRRLGDLGVSSGEVVVITVDILTSGNGGGAQGFLAVSERVAQATTRVRGRARGAGERCGAPNPSPNPHHLPNPYPNPNPSPNPNPNPTPTPNQVSDAALTAALHVEAARTTTVTEVPPS
eukprot:scaffold24724_cov48-Phaeocystis_antarctica.AAC.1